MASVSRDESCAAAAEELEATEANTSVAHSARIWDYWLGGKDNFSADRVAGDAVLEAAPYVRDIARAGRAFLACVVNHPLLTGTPEGVTACIDADARDTGKILTLAAKTLDFSQPVAVMLLGILLFIPDADDPWAITAQLMDALPAGSYLAVSHGASDIRAESGAAASSRYNQHTPTSMRSTPSAAPSSRADSGTISAFGIRIIALCGVRVVSQYDVVMLVKET